jgi:hypothetical protein
MRKLPWGHGPSPSVHVRHSALTRMRLPSSCTETRWPDLVSPTTPVVLQERSTLGRSSTWRTMREPSWLVQGQAAYVGAIQAVKVQHVQDMVHGTW